MNRRQFLLFAFVTPAVVPHAVAAQTVAVKPPRQRFDLQARQDLHSTCWQFEHNGRVYQWRHTNQYYDMSNAHIAPVQLLRTYVRGLTGWKGKFHVVSVDQESRNYSFLAHRAIEIHYSHSVQQSDTSVTIQGRQWYRTRHFFTLNTPEYEATLCRQFACFSGRWGRDVISAVPGYHIDPGKHGLTYRSEGDTVGSCPSNSEWEV